MRGSWMLRAIALALAAPAMAQSGGDAAARCAALAGSAAIPGVTIASARLVPVTPPNTLQFSPFAPDRIPVAIGPYCLAEGMIDARKGADGTAYGYGFALALPVAWNGRYLHQGGGGANGTTNPPLGVAGAGDVPALARGFAVMSTDGGHKGAVFDFGFFKDQKAALAFVHDSVGRVAEVAKALIAQHYGRPAERSYIAGCSTGGREAMLGVQRYPDLFDGAVAGAPAMRAGQSRIAAEWAAVAFNQAAAKSAATGEPRASRLFSPADRKLLLGAVLNSCDAADGLRDGMIADPVGCRFDPATIQCRAGKETSCLSAPQVTALATAFAGPKDSRGRQAYPAFPWDTGLVAETQGPSFLPSDAPSPLGPPSKATTIDVDAMVTALHEAPTDRLTDTYYWTNLSSFAQHGGKILFWHGASDPWFAIADTIDHHERVTKANPPGTSAMYVVPGVGHCSGGPGLDRFDALGALVDWVEKGAQPAAIRATGSAFPGRSRPLCPWPAHAVYKGSGKEDDAASFECRR